MATTILSSSSCGNCKIRRIKLFTLQNWSTKNVCLHLLDWQTNTLLSDGNCDLCEVPAVPMQWPQWNEWGGFTFSCSTAVSRNTTSISEERWSWVQFIVVLWHQHTSKAKECLLKTPAAIVFYASPHWHHCVSLLINVHQHFRECHRPIFQCQHLST